MDNENNLEEIKKDLYRREFKEKRPSIRPLFYTRGAEASSEWAASPREEKDERASPLTMFQKIFFASLVFFVIALAVAASIFFSGGNIVSSENVDVQVLGPISVGAGDELSLQISVTNDNAIAIENTDLVIEYPDGTRTVEGGDPLPRFRKSLDTIAAGETVIEVQKSSLYGSEGSDRLIRVSVEYRIAGSNAIFVKSADYHASLSSAPLSLSVESLSEVAANQETTIEVTIASNAKSPVEQVLLRAEYPSGFTFLEASPKPRYGTALWDLGTIEPGTIVPIVIKGFIDAQDNEQKVFSFATGRRDEKSERNIGAVYGLSSSEIFVKRPFLSMTTRINGSDAPKVVADGEVRVSIDIGWSNNLPSRISDVTITANLSGRGFDESSVGVSRGAYRSADNIIVWNKETNGDFASVEAGESGTVSFSFIAQTGSGSAQYVNPRLKASFNISGRRLSESGAMEDISSVLTREVVVNSNLRLSARALYYSGPFQKSGPMPPRAERETTYTIVWTAANASNDMANVVVRGILPPAVSWLNTVDPPSSAENISYDPKTGEIVWRAGDMKAGTGFARAAPEIAFQVGLTPSISDVGKAPDIVRDISISGKDLFTGENIQNVRPPLTTNLTTDSSFQSEHAQVVK